MKVFPKKDWFIYISIVIVMLFSCGHGFAASGTLHSSSMEALEKRVATANPDEWRFVFLGDNRGNDGTFKEALQRAKEFDPLFILHGGDIAERGTADELAHFIKTVSEVPNLPPLFIVRGNHEINVNLFENTIGPRNFTIDNPRLGFRMVAVDNADYSLKEKEIDYLSKALDQKRPIQLVSMHIPPKTERWSKHSFEKGKNELIRLMVERKVKLGLFAHIHLYDKDEINGIPCIISGGAGAQLTWFGYTGEATYHIVVVEVNKGIVSYQIVRL
jgi:Icc-related predicted phosphoesterase